MLKIISENGLGHDTRILDAETGEDVGKIVAVQSCQIAISREGITAELKIAFLGVDLKPSAAFWKTKHPRTGDYVAVEAIEFGDGTRVEFNRDGTPKIVAT